MTVGALEICASRLDLRRDIPTAASFIGNQRKIKMISDFLDKGSVGLNRPESVVNGKGGASQGG
jgi:hypothetical protein